LESKLQTKDINRIINIALEYLGTRRGRVPNKFKVPSNLGNREYVNELQEKDEVFEIKS
jgi:hypothetical protein